MRVREDLHDKNSPSELKKIGTQRDLLTGLVTEIYHDVTTGKKYFFDTENKAAVVVSIPER